MTDRINLIMQEIERIVQAKLDDGQTVEDLEKGFDKLVLECLPALTASNRQVGKSHTNNVISMDHGQSPDFGPNRKRFHFGPNF